jgi:hypothetical protein
MPVVNALGAAKLYSLVADKGLRHGAPRVAADAGAIVAAAPISVECASGARLSEIAFDWLSLIGRAHESNVFMDPAVIQTAERHLPDRRCVTLLAWQRTGETQALVGLWGFSIGAPAHSLMPHRALLSPPVPHGYLATPVIDRTVAEDALNAMLNFIACDPTLPKLIALDQIASDGPTMQALTRVLAARGGAAVVLAEARRPMLKPGLDGKQYFEMALSSSSRKKLRQHRRRLEEKGALALKSCSEPAAVAQAFDEFLQLEAAGWKGRRGTALLCSAAEAAFARGMVAALAARGKTAVHALYLDGKPVSMQIVLRAGAAAFTWKTAYDEAMNDFSPGMLLLEDYTKAFLADASVASVDSCAYDESGFMSVWTDRAAIAQAWIDVRRGSSFSFLALGRLQKTFLGLRAVAKEKYLTWRRAWKKNS